MYSVVVGDVLFVSQELETSNGVLFMDIPWVPIPDDLFDVSIYLSLSVEQVTVVLASAARTLRYVHCRAVLQVSSHQYSHSYRCAQFLE